MRPTSVAPTTTKRSVSPASPAQADAEEHAPRRPGAPALPTTARAPAAPDAARYHPGHASAAARLLSSSALPRAAPGTVQLAGPVLNRWTDPRQLLRSHAATGWYDDASTHAATDTAAPETAAPDTTVPDAATPVPPAAEAGATDLTAGTIESPLTVFDERRSALLGPGPGHDGASWHPWDGDVMWVPSVEATQSRKAAVERSGAAAVETDPLTSPATPGAVETGVSEAERQVAEMENDLDLATRPAERGGAVHPSEGAAPVAPGTAEPGGAPPEPAPAGEAQAEPTGAVDGDVAAWQARVQGAAHAMPRRTAAPEGTYSAPIVTAGDSGTKRLAAKAEQIPLEAKKVLEARPFKPLPEAPGVPEPDPVPRATQRLRELAVRKLPDQRLPRLVASPNGFLPVIGAPPVDTKVPAAPPPVPKTKRGVRSGTPAKTVNEAIAQEVRPLAPGEGQVLTGSERMATPTIAAPHRADITKVLARIYLQAQEMGTAVMKEARRTAYPVDLNGGGLKDIGKEQEENEAVWFRQELGRVAEAASIGKAALDAAVTQRAEELAKTTDAHAVEVAEKAQEQVRRANEAAERARAIAASSYEAWERHFDTLAARAKGNVDPVAVRAEQERVSTELRSFASTHTTAWIGIRKNRERDLERAYRDQVTAYQEAALADQAQRAKVSATEPMTPEQKAKATVTELTDPALLQWVKDRKAEVGKAVLELRTALTTLVDGWITSMNTARDEGVEAVRAWADGRIGRERGWFETLVAEFLQRLSTKEADNKALQEAQTDETVAALGGTLQVINDLKLGGMERLDRDGKELLGKMTAEEQALVQAYFSEGTAKGDTVLLLASLLSLRLRGQRVPSAQQHVRDEVLKLDNVQHWKNLQTIGQAQNPSFEAARISDKLWEAFEHFWGTDEEKAILAVKGGLTQEQGKAVRGAYAAAGRGDLDARMESELSGTDLQRVKYGFEGKQAEADAAALKEAMGHVFSNDQTLIRETLRNKSEPERRALADAYKRLYKRDLQIDFALELRGDDRNIVGALWAGNVERADAIEIKVAREGFWGPDHEKVEKVYTRVREEATKQGDAKGWKTEQINAEIARRTGKLATEYQGYTKRALLDDLEKTFDPPTDWIRDRGQREAARQYWAGRRDLVMGMATGDLVRADAGKIQIERTGVYAKDETVNKVLSLQYSRAYEAARRDALVDFAANNNGRGPNKEEMQALEKAAEQTAKTEGTASMGRLGAYFEKTYTGGRETFRETIADLTQGVDEEKGLSLVDQGGYLEDWQVLEYATKGAGTDEDEFQRVLKKQKNKKDQEALQTLWQQKTGTTRSIADLIHEETSGRLEADLLLDNKHGGEPDDPTAMVAKATDQLDFERRSGGESTYVDAFGRVQTVKSHEYRVLEQRLEDLKAAAKAHEQTKDLPADDPRKAWTQAQLNQGVQAFTSGVETHRFLVDQRTEIAAQVVTMAVTIVVAVVITVATGGVGSVAAAGLIAGVASLFGAAAGIATKMSMKGAAYGTDELGMDIALGVVDAAVSAATAGVGGRLLKGATAAAKTAGPSARGLVVTLGRMAEGTAVKRAAAHAITEGAEGFLQSLPTAVLGTALNEKTWTEGNPLFNMLAGVGMGVGLGTIASGTIGGLTNLRGAKATAAAMPGEVPAVQGRLVDLVPGTADHARLQASYFEINPGRTKADFQRDLDGILILQAKHNPEIKARLEARLRDNIGDLLPAGQKSVVNDAPVELWDTKRFEEFTGSRTGHAVVIIKDGRPTVIVKQGADRHEIAQEGFHLLQAMDKRTRAKVARLDESVMSRWSSLDVREKLVLYREKLDLELDAQRSMIAALETRARAKGALDDSELAERLARARETLGNLEKRSGDLARIGPLQRQLLGWGVLPPPRWLDQPARLFAKAPPAPKPKVKKPKKKASAPSAAPEPPRPISENQVQARHAYEWAADIEAAHARGYTFEHRPVELGWKEHPLLLGQLQKMRNARKTFENAVKALGTPPDPAAFQAATKALRETVSETSEVLRSFGKRFEVTSTVHQQANQATVASRANTLHHRHAPEKVFDALTAADVRARAAGELGEPLARKLPGLGLEKKAALSARGIAKLKTQPSWLGRRLATLLRGYQRAHLIGPGFGGEAVAGLMLAPHGVNQLVQNKGIEKLLRDAAAVGGEVHITAQARGRELAIPLANGKFDSVQVLESVTYSVLRSDGTPMTFRNAQGKHVPMTFTIEVQPGRGWRAHYDLPTGLIDTKLPLSGTF